MGILREIEFFLCPYFLAKSFRAIGIGQGISHKLVSGLHVGLHNSAKLAVFRQDFLPRVIVDTKWIMARPQSTNTKKTKSKIGLHHGIFLFRHLGEKLNTTL